MLIESSEQGSYLVPPLVFDHDGNLIEGHDVVEAMRQTGVTIDSTDGGLWRGRTASGSEVVMPYLMGRTVGDLAGIDQVMAAISDQLGVPVGPPQAAGGAR